MTHRHPLAIVAGAATVLAAMPLYRIFASFTWLVYVMIAVALITATAMGIRSARGPVWAQVLAMLATLLLFVTFLFPSGAEFLGLFPTTSTFVHFNELFVAAGEHIRDEAVPVSDLDGLLLLTTAGVGLVAIVVDFLAVGIRRPALAGLPMLAIYSVPVAVLAEGLSIFPFVFAAAGYLWLLVADSVDRVRRFGRRFTGEGRDVDLWEPSPLAAAGRRLGVVGVLVALLIPLAVPGMTSGLLENFGPDGGGGGGNGRGGGTRPTVDLFALLSGNLTQDRSFDMVRVTTDDPTPFYLRFGVADVVTRDGFVNQSPVGTVNVNRGLPEVHVPAGPGLSARRFQAQVDVLALDMQLAPLFQQVRDIRGLDGSWFFDAATHQVFTRRSTIDKRSYQFDFVRIGYTPEALRTAAPVNTADPNLRALTEVPFVQQVSDLVGRLTGGRTTQYDRVRSIYGHFAPANGYTYTTRTEPGDSGHAIVDFLNSRRGFCLQYAAAMTWLVRSAGYPARVAFGFTRGRTNVSGRYVMTNLNLHAWTEVFFPNFGWVPFDATPSGPLAGSVTSAWAPDLSNPDPSASPGLPGGDDPTARPSASGIGGSVDEQGGPGDSAGGGPAINLGSLFSATAAALLVALLLAPSLRRHTLRRRRRARSGEVIVLGDDGRPAPGSPPPDLVLDSSAVATAQRDAHEAWQELIDTMVDFNVVVDEAETPRATAVRLGRLSAFASAGREPARLLARAEERARYARMPLRPVGLDAAVAAARAALAEYATRRQRIVATLLPRSVLLRWRAVWVGWLSQAVVIAARIREAVVVISPRRLLTNRTRTSP